MQDQSQYPTVLFRFMDSFQKVSFEHGFFLCTPGCVGSYLVATSSYLQLPKSSNYTKRCTTTFQVATCSYLQLPETVKFLKVCTR